MKASIKKKWVSALRSGEYKQTKDTLRDDSGFCCLGVLCDIYAKENGMPTWTEDELSSEDAALPCDAIKRWAGLVDVNPTVEIDESHESLSRHNDDWGRTFSQIADAIEAQL